MNRRIGIASSTHVDAHGHCMSLQALESMVQQTNGQYAIGLDVEHLTSLPPLGKVRRAWIEPSADGEHLLFIDQEIFEAADLTEIGEFEGSLLLQASSDDQRPFAVALRDAEVTPQIEFDPINFDDGTVVELEESAQNLGIAVSPTLVRKALLPPPEIMIFLGQLSEGFATRAGEDLYDGLKELLVKAARRLKPAQEPPTYVFHIDYTPKIQLIVRSRDTDAVTNSILPPSLAAVREKVEQLNRTYPATNVQFLLHDDGTWKFRFLLTRDGRVIGTREVYDELAHQARISFGDDLG